MDDDDLPDFDVFFASWMSALAAFRLAGVDIAPVAAVWQVSVQSASVAHVVGAWADM